MQKAIMNNITVNNTSQQGFGNVDYNSCSACVIARLSQLHH